MLRADHSMDPAGILVHPFHTSFPGGLSVVTAPTGEFHLEYGMACSIQQDELAVLGEHSGLWIRIEFENVTVHISQNTSGTRRNG